MTRDSYWCCGDRQCGLKSVNEPTRSAGYVLARAGYYLKTSKLQLIRLQRYARPMQMTFTLSGTRHVWAGVIRELEFGEPTKKLFRYQMMMTCTVYRQFLLESWHGLPDNLIICPVSVNQVISELLPKCGDSRPRWHFRILKWVPVLVTRSQ